MKRSILGAMLLFLCGCGDDGDAPPLPETATDDNRRWCLWLGYEYTEGGNLKDHFKHAYCAVKTSASGTCSDDCEFRAPLKTCGDATIGSCAYTPENRACVIAYKMLMAFTYQGVTCEGLAGATPALADFGDVSGVSAVLGTEEAAADCVARAAQCPEIFEYIRLPNDVAE